MYLLNIPAKIKNYAENTSLKKIIISSITASVVFCATTAAITAGAKWLWTIGKTEVTLGQFDRDYDAFLTMIAWQYDMDADQLKEFMARAKKEPNVADNKLLKQLSRQSFAENYERILLLRIDAQNKGFLKKEKTRALLNFIRDYYLSQMYLSDSYAKVKHDISEDELLELWERQKQENPEYAQVPINEGINMMRKQMIKNRQYEWTEQFLKELKKQYNLKRSSDFKKHVGG